MRYLLTLVVSVFILRGTPVEGIVVGNPCEAAGAGGIALAVESERFEDTFDRDEVRSQRYLAKLTYGLAPRLDVFVKLGTGALHVSPEGESSSSTFAGDAQLALGGGVRAETSRFRSLGGCRLFTSLQYLQFTSEGEFLREETHKDWTWDERLVTSYDWREVGVSAGLCRAFGKGSLYGGLAFTHVTGSIEREQFVLSEGSSMKVGEGREDFSEGLGSGIFVGLDFALSGALRFSTEYQLNDRHHGTLFVGLSERME